MCSPISGSTLAATSSHSFWIALFCMTVSLLSFQPQRLRVYLLLMGIIKARLFEHLVAFFGVPSFTSETFSFLLFLSVDAH